MNPWAEPFDQYSSKIFFKQLRWYGFYPLGKSPPQRGGEKTE